jgi:small-conductance mechanosensitive channel
MDVTMPISDALSREFLNNSLQHWLTAAITAVVLFAVLLVGRHLLLSRLGAIAERTTNHVDDTVVAMLKETRTWVLLTLSILTGVHTLNLGRVSPYLRALDSLILLWQIALWGAAAIEFWMRHHLERRTDSHDRASIAMISAMAVGAKVILWMIVLTTALYNVFGINPTSLITTLGVSGIAVALAVQNILGDLLAALAIVFDKPFDVGDPIGVDQITGVVEHIGLKTTRLRSTTGEQIIIGNGDMLKSRLRNFRRMTQRRVQFNLDVPFDTSAEILSKLPSIVQEIITAQSPVRFERCHVSSFAESAIRLETVYYVTDPDYTKYMDAQQAINLEILRRFSGENVKFALPSRTVYHEGPMAKDLSVGNQPQASTG